VVLPPSNTGATEEYDGTSWTTSSKFSNSKTSFSRCRYTNSSFSFWWYDPPVTAATEEYNDYGEPNTFENIGQVWYNGTTKALKFTDETFSSAWATGNNMNTARYALAGAGTQTAALAFGGNVPPLQEQQKNMMEIVGNISLIL
jgi:hypothetical protein